MIITERATQDFSDKYSKKIRKKGEDYSLWLLILLVTVLPLFSLSERSSKDLPQRHKKWLDVEVSYIITPKEKEVFLKLESDKERDLFIEAFWKQRDHTPSTPENEFKEDHYQRIKYANKMFSRGTTKPGWKTDRGKI